MYFVTGSAEPNSAGKLGLVPNGFVGTMDPRRLLLGGSWQPRRLVGQQVPRKGALSWAGVLVTGVLA